MEMALLRTLPLLEGAKTVVVDEGSEAMYGRALVAGWLQMWRSKDSKCEIELLAFSDPKSWYSNEPEPFTSANLHIYDYYTLDINKSEDRDSQVLSQILKTTKHKSVVIVDCLSSLVVYVGLARALRFIHKLGTQVQQLICIYRRDFVQNKVPHVETLGTTYVRLDKFSGIRTSNDLMYIVEIIHQKLGGSVIHHIELVTQNILSYEITSEKMISNNNEKKEQTSLKDKEKIESSFRIEINAHEMEQREKTPLPYTLNTHTLNTSKIIYQPDDADDLDEEDPDDDLCI